MWFWGVGGVGTVLWAILCWWLVGAKLPGLPQLAANEIGDTLAGLSAPLAFLWLVVATGLQRQELGLQREELRETREVFSKELVHVEAAANESAAQTKIMLDQVVFNEHRLRMYYLAQYLMTEAIHLSLLLASSTTQNLFQRPDIRLDENIENVDAVHAQFASWLKGMRFTRLARARPGRR